MEHAARDSVGVPNATHSLVALGLAVLPTACAHAGHCVVAPDRAPRPTVFELAVGDG